MSSEVADEAKRRIIGRASDWVKSFDVDEHVKHPPLIEKLHEEKQLALVRSNDLEEQVSDLSNRIHELEKENQKLILQHDEIKKDSLTIFVLSLIAAILASIGANLATGQPNNYEGWVMIISAVVLEFIAFFRTR